MYFCLIKSYQRSKVKILTNMSLKKIKMYFKIIIKNNDYELTHTLTFNKIKINEKYFSKVAKAAFLILIILIITYTLYNLNKI